MLTTENWRQCLQRGFTLTTSGTTGTPKSVFQTPEKLAAANRVAIEAQGIMPGSRVLTVSRMTHAGGALAQTLPALSIGAQVDIVPFNVAPRGDSGQECDRRAPADAPLDHHLEIAAKRIGPRGGAESARVTA